MGKRRKKRTMKIKKSVCVGAHTQGPQPKNLHISIVRCGPRKSQEKRGFLPRKSLVKDINFSDRDRKMAVMERKTRAGRTITTQQYTKPAEHKGKRERKNGGTSEAQKAGNMRRAVMMLTWLMNANFQDGDLLVTLDYKRERRPEDSIRMNKDFTNFYKPPETETEESRPAAAQVHPGGGGGEQGGKAPPHAPPVYGPADTEKLLAGGRGACGSPVYGWQTTGRSQNIL